MASRLTGPTATRAHGVLPGCAMECGTYRPVAEHVRYVLLMTLPILNFGSFRSPLTGMSSLISPLRSFRSAIASLTGSFVACRAFDPISEGELVERYIVLSIEFVLDDQVGGMIWGYCVTGRRLRNTTPMIIVIMAITLARIGLSMKNAEIIRRVGFGRRGRGGVRRRLRRIRVGPGVSHSGGGLRLQIPRMFAALVLLSLAGIAINFRTWRDRGGDHAAAWRGLIRLMDAAHT